MNRASPGSSFLLPRFGFEGIRRRPECPPLFAARVQGRRLAPVRHHRSVAAWRSPRRGLGSAVEPSSSRNLLFKTILEQEVFATQGVAPLLGKKCAYGRGAGGLRSRCVRDVNGDSLATLKGEEDNDADHRDRSVGSSVRWRGRLLLQETGALVAGGPAPHSNLGPRPRPVDDSPGRAESDEERPSLPRWLLRTPIR